MFSGVGGVTLSTAAWPQSGVFVPSTLVSVTRARNLCPNGKDRGGWESATKDYRDNGYDWLVVSTIKDIALNVLVVVFPSDGTSQLMVAAIVLALHGLRCSRTLPYNKMESNRLEIVLTIALFCQVSFAAGAGFELSDLEDGSDVTDNLKGSGGFWFLLLSYCSMVVPFVVVVWIVLLSFQWGRRRVPKSLRALDPDEKKQRIQSVLQLHKDGETMTKQACLIYFKIEML